MGALAALVLTGCGQDTPPETAPAPITFQLRNDAPTPLFLHQDCRLDLTIESITNPGLTLDGGSSCFCLCDQCFGPLQCGECGLASAQKVAPVSTVLFTWSPISIALETQGSFQCGRIRAAPAGSYRISVPVFPTEADGTAKTNGRVASQTFTLPAEAAIPVTLFTPP